MEVFSLLEFGISNAWAQFGWLRGSWLQLIYQSHTSPKFALIRFLQYSHISLQRTKNINFDQELLSRLHLSKASKLDFQICSFEVLERLCHIFEKKMVIEVLLNKDTVNFLGISIVGKSSKDGQGDCGIYVG